MYIYVLSVFVCLCSLAGRAEERFPSPVRVLCHVCMFFLYFLLMLFVRLPLNAPSRQQYKVNSGESSERAANSASQIPKMSSKHTRHSASGGRRSHHGF
jgi:hypothetical protein